MVLVSIDDKKAEVLAQAPGSLNDFVQGIMSSLPPDRVVTEIFLNGRRVPGLNGLAGFEFQGVEDLQIRTASKRMWAADGIENAIGSIQRLQQSFLKVTEMCQDVDFSSAKECLACCIEGVEKFLETMCITQNVLAIDFTQVTVGNGNLRQVELELVKIIGQMKHPATLYDLEAVAERVEYELLPNLHAWNAALHRLRTQARLQD